MGAEGGHTLLAALPNGIKNKNRLFSKQRKQGRKYPKPGRKRLKTALLACLHEWVYQE